MPYIFTSKRLGFRSFRKSDAAIVFRNHNEKDFKQWVSNENYADIAEAAEAIRFFIARVSGQRLPYVLAIEVLETGELIGDIGLNEVAGRIGEVEIGFGICEKQQGRGYATEAVAAMSKFIASKFPVKALYGRVMQGNDASCRVLNKSGFRYQGIETGAADDPYGKGMLIFVRTL